MRRAVLTLSLALACVVSAPAPAAASDCDTPAPEWLFCEDFEGGDAGWDTWFAASPFVECLGCSAGNTENPERILLTRDATDVHDGSWALAMPATAQAGYQGASLTWRSCDGEKRPGCMLTGHDQIHYRAWLKLDPDHAYVHHFMSIGGTRPDGYWDSDGNAGCRPNGERAAGSTVDFELGDSGEHELFFYTYTPDMRCDQGGYCSGDYAQDICDGCATKDMACDTNGLECCWGNHYSADPRPVLPRGQWVCLEMMMRLNTPGQADGEMAFWVDGELGHRETGMSWREVAELQLNKVWVQHYIASGDADQSNRIVWDDIVASTAPIGCGAPPTPMDTDASSGDTAGTPDTTSSPDTSSTADTAASPDTASGDTHEQPASDTEPAGVDVPEPDATAGDDTRPPSMVDTAEGDDGCGCRLTAQRPSGEAPLLLALLGAVGLLLRRRCEQG